MILRNYLKNEPNTPLYADIMHLIARLGVNNNQELALREFEKSINQEHLTGFISALIEVTRGIDQRIYFDAINRDMSVLNKENMKRTIAKRPGKIKKATIAMVICAMLIYLVPLTLQMANGMSLFN